MLYSDPESPIDPDDAVAAAHAMFNRVLAPWAMDLLALRKRGLDRPGSRPGRGLFAADPPRRDTLDFAPDRRSAAFDGLRRL